jgi:cytochrome c oxidase assembly factor CtaG
MPPLTMHTGVTVWQFAPVVSAGLLVAAALYLWGALRVRRRHPARPWPWLRSVCFLGGLLVVALATESSVGAYDDQLFYIHMIQHLLLIMVAPPLLVVGRPVTLALHASRNPLHTVVKRLIRSRLVSLLTWPPVAFLLYAAVIVGTHLTSFMNVVLRHPVVHDSEHALYLLAGYLFFLPLLGSEPIRWRMSYPGRFLLIALAMPVDTFVGVVLTQTNHELFSAYAARHRPWMPSLVGDLHAGGAVMWVGGDGLMLAFFVVVFLMFLRDNRARGTAGAWLEGVRRTALAEHAAQVGVVAAPRTGRRALTIDDDDEAERLAYNDYLAALAARERRSPGPAAGPVPAGRDGAGRSADPR